MAQSGTLPSHTGTESCVSGHVASDMCDAIFRYLVLGDEGGLEEGWARVRNLRQLDAFRKFGLSAVHAERCGMQRNICPHWWRMLLSSLAWFCLAPFLHREPKFLEAIPWFHVGYASFPTPSSLRHDIDASKHALHAPSLSLHGNCAPTNTNTFNKSKYEKSVDFSGTATRSGSSQHVSMRDVNCKVSKVF